MDQNTRKSVQLKLSFPYDWSNPNIRQDALILNVLDRGIYEDICRVAAHYGIDIVQELAGQLDTPPHETARIARMLNNIKTGFSRAQTR